MSAARPRPDVARMLTLVPWLLERPGARVDEIAEVFATDPATIRAELEHLDYCGLPGLGGGALFDVTVIDDVVTVRMADELRYPLRPSPQEALRLLLIGVAAERVAGADVPALRSALGKLHDALGVTPGAVTVLDAEPDDAVRTLRAAIAEGVRVRFTYRGRTDTTPSGRRVEPWAVELHEGAWYLHGHDVDAGEARIFRIDRAADLEPTAERATSVAPDRLDRPAYAPTDDDLAATLTLTPGAHWLLDALTADDVAPHDDEGTVRVRLRTAAPEWVARLVLMTGGGATVVQPPELRERVRSLAQEALDRLGEASPQPTRPQGGRS